jgi:hypothetical protein
LSVLSAGCSSKGTSHEENGLYWQKKFISEFYNYQVKEDWLIEKVSLSELKEQNKPPVEGDEWSKTHYAWFTGKYRKGDEIWRFSNPAEMWESLQGVHGYVLFHKGKQIATLITDTSNIEMFLVF